MSEESKMKEQEDFFLAENDRVLNGAPRPTIAQVAWVMSALSESVSREGCSFRRTIYGLMGFGPEAYVPIYEAGGMNVTNAIVEASDRADLMQAGAQAERKRILKIAEGLLSEFREHCGQLESYEAAAALAGVQNCFEQLKQRIGENDFDPPKG